MEEKLKNNLKFPELIYNINEWAFKFKYEFYKKLEDFLSSGIIIDYISAKLIKFNQLALLSTRPPVELNIINGPLFFHDKSYSVDNFFSKKPILWCDAFDDHKFNELKSKKMDFFGLTAAISLYAQNKEHIISISFATQRKDNNINEYYHNNIEYFSKIACFVEKIAYPMFCEIFSTKIDKNLFRNKSNYTCDPKIMLIVNNNI